MTVSKSGFEPVAATVLLTFCEKLRTVPSDHFRLPPTHPSLKWLLYGLSTCYCMLYVLHAVLHAVVV